ncbi:MAG: N-acetyltransferase [Ignavibacteria bacterium]|nr:N-acetyltransferase [Ignavibacteria bacterium]
MELLIRQETSADYTAVFDITQKAFAQLEVSDHTEQFLVERLRASDGFIPELSLVAVCDGKIAAHILFTRLYIVTNDSRHESLILAPVSVLPEQQSKGVGSALINHGHEVARGLGYSSVVLVGHKDYYPRFGYKKLSGFGISIPFPAPDECCLGLELVPGALQNIHGIVEFPPAFLPH